MQNKKNRMRKLDDQYLSESNTDTADIFQYCSNQP